MGDDRPHLHARAFAAEGHAGADRQEAAKEFDRDQPRRRRRQFAAQRRLDLRDAAARRVGRKPANQPGGAGDCRGAAGGDQNEPGEALLMGAADQRVAPAIGRGQRQPENRDDQARPGSGERRQQGQRQQAAITLARLSPATPPIHRRSGTPRRRRPVQRRQDCVRYLPISATSPLLSAAGRALLWRGSNIVQGACHDRTSRAPPDHRRNPPRHLGRPLPRRHRRFRDPRSRRQRDRRRLRRRDRAWRLAERSGRCRRRRADHDLPRREPRGGHDRRARHLAKGARPRIVHARAWRQDPQGRAAHRGSGRTRRLDHRAQALGHDELWRGRGGGDPARPRGLSNVSADGPEPEAARSRPPRLAVLGGDLSARRPGARSRRHLPPDRPRRVIAIHGR